MTPHERVTFRGDEGIAANLRFCASGFGYFLTYPVRRLPLCWVGLHEWCACCSPVSCRRCGVQGHD